MLIPWQEIVTRSLAVDAEARTSYKRSLKEDMLVNFWGMSRLTGN